MSVDSDVEDEDRLLQSRKSSDDVGRHVIHPVPPCVATPQATRPAPPALASSPSVETARVKAKGVGPLSGAAASQAAPRSRRAYRVGSL